MPDGQVLEFTRVTKRFNDVTAVSDLSARVEPGVVTAFLGPNGAGKTTSLRILLGQVRATSGTATIGGVAYPELRHPLRTIGAVLEETVYRPRRSATRHLTIAAKANGIPLSRVDEVLSLVGLEHEAEGRIGSFSLGMRQRLSVAHALLGDPGALVFDEPANGLDPEGIRWMRLLMRRLADEGRTVLVSSHVLSEVEQVADHVLVLSKGQLVLSSGIETLADPSGGSVVVDSVDRAGLRSALSAAGFEVEVLRSGLRVRGGDAQTVGAIAASAGVALSSLAQRGPTLEDVFIELVRGGTLGPRAVAAASAAVVAQEPATDPADGADAAQEADAPGAASEVHAVAPPTAGAPEPEAEPDAEQFEQTEDPATAPSGDGDTEQGADIEPEQSPEPEAAADIEPAAPGADADDAPAPSFDDILFGTGDASVAGGEEQPAGGEEQSAEAVDTTAADDQDADASGVDIFDDLGEGVGDADASDGDDSRADASDGDADTDDARSAAVTSMLAAAARAYYDDEPADYPVGDAEDATEDSPERRDDAATDAAGDDAHWSVASTGVIDQVPAWAPSGDADQTAEQDDSRDGATDDGEPNHDGEHQGEVHDGEHSHDGEHRHD
ncbi:ATP-binding cassette domain-containing protein [Microbacterium sp. NPDC089695]|uniref:ATP-binding cassette domain-containing protein n=1 Tax=Microbacterium sp. NPDC089695 TaxID=3364198 RepID=UPI0038302F0D